MGISVIHAKRHREPRSLVILGRAGRASPRARGSACCPPCCQHLFLNKFEYSRSKTFLADLRSFAHLYFCPFQLISFYTFLLYLIESIGYPMDFFQNELLEDLLEEDESDKCNITSVKYNIENESPLTVKKTSVRDVVDTDTNPGPIPGGNPALQERLLSDTTESSSTSSMQLSCSAGKGRKSGSQGYDLTDVSKLDYVVRLADSIGCSDVELCQCHSRPGKHCWENIAKLYNAYATKNTRSKRSAISLKKKYHSLETRAPTKKKQRLITDITSIQKSTSSLHALCPPLTKSYLAEASVTRNSSPSEVMPCSEEP